MAVRTGIARPLAYRSVLDLIAGALLAGLVAGLAMALFSVILFATAGQRVDVPFRIIASTFGATWALASGRIFTPALLGLIVHLAFSLGWALAFAGLIGRVSTAKAVAWGFVYGAGISVLMRFTVLPLVNPMLALTPRWTFFAAHAVYGLALGLIPVFTSWVDRRRGEEEGLGLKT